MFLIISDLTIVEYSNAPICEQASLHLPCNYSVHKQQCHYNALQSRVQVVDHSFSGLCLTYRGNAINVIFKKILISCGCTLAVTKHKSAFVFSNLIHNQK